MTSALAPRFAARSRRGSAWREDDLREAGYDFVRWGYGRMFGQTDQTVARILRKLNG